MTDALPTGLISVPPPTATPAGHDATVAANTWTWNIPTLTKAVAPATSNTLTATFDATVDPSTTLPTITNTVTVIERANGPDVDQQHRVG